MYLNNGQIIPLYGARTRFSAWIIQLSWLPRRLIIWAFRKHCAEIKTHDCLASAFQTLPITLFTLQCIEERPWVYFLSKYPFNRILSIRVWPDQVQAGWVCPCLARNLKMAKKCRRTANRRAAYQRLNHPAGTQGSTIDREQHKDVYLAIRALVHSAQRWWDEYQMVVTYAGSHIYQWHDSCKTNT